MGLFKKLSSAAGHVDKKLIERGLLARGQIIHCKRTALSTGVQVPSVVCKLTVLVDLPGHEPYEAECTHPIQMPYLPQFESGQGSVAVRVDPDDLTNIELDLEHDVPPPSGFAASPLSAAGPSAGIPAGSDLAAPLPTHAADPSLGGAAGVLANGISCRAILLAVMPLDATTSTGQPATGLVLSVTVVGQAPFQAQVGLYVPPEAQPLLDLGADLPAKTMPGRIDAVVVDWDAALAEAAGAPHQSGSAVPSAAPAADLAASLKQLADLHSAGALSDAEFKQAKDALLTGG